jgi:membrane protease YdiL (CAAX protease family)
VELAALGAFVTLAAHAVPLWLFGEVWPALGDTRRRVIDLIGRPSAYHLVCLGVALLLALPTARRSGLVIGRVRGLGWKLIGICAVPVVLTAIVYTRLPVRPFAGAPVSMWLISPAAQELFFLGYLYGRFAERFDRPLFPRVPVNGALVMTAAFFASWHLVNFFTMPPGYVAFQLCYTFAMTLWTGMTRVMTGSLIWAIAVHMAVNAVAWATP